jgi:hypothetical protein
MSRLRALLATLRIANAPSVLSNVWLGYITSWYLWFGSWIPLDTGMIRLDQLACLLVSALLLYFSGNLANDWHDREWDLVRRPERALPSGLFSPGIYLGASVALAVAGGFIAFRVNPCTGIAAVGIVILIVIYTWIHKRTSWGVIPMGLCRAGLYVLGSLAFWPDAALRQEILDVLGSEPFSRHAIIVITFSSGLFSYITGLSLSARYEGMSDPPEGARRLSRMLLAFPLLALPCAFGLLGFSGVLPLAVWLALCWTRYKQPIPRYVSALLAGIPLVDLTAAIPLGIALAFIKSNGVVNPPLGMTIVAIPLIAFVLGRLLQKVAPAT